MVSPIAGSSSSILGSNLFSLSRKENSLFNKLSTGKETAKPSDSKNLGSLVKAASLTSAINGLSVVNQSVQSTGDTLNTAAGGLNSTLENLHRLRDLAVQASDGTISSTDRASIQNQSSSLLSSINATAQQVNVNGVNLLDGSFQNKTIQVGPNAGDTLTVNIDSATSEALGLGDVDLSDESSSSDSITAIDNAINQVTSQLADIGSSQNRMSSILQTNQSSSINLSQSRSTLEDLDFAKATSEIQTIQIRKSFAIQLLGQVNEGNKSAFSALL